MEPHLTLYVRGGCHLCDDALDILRDAHDVRSFELDVVDVTGDAGLEAYYGERVPVLVCEGRVLAQAPMDADEVVAALVNL